jgi:hypothetical protein
MASAGSLTLHGASIVDPFPTPVMVPTAHRTERDADRQATCQPAVRSPAADASWPSGS